VIDLDGKEALIFLIRSDDSYAKGFYFAGSSPEALQVFSSELAEHLKKEVLHQKEILMTFEGTFTSKQEKLYPKVKRLVEAALDSKKAHRSFKRLEALGDECVPSIIMLMVDALAAILNQLTSEYISITM
jgi:hypothetical protein